ncbi:MAG: ATP synthase delta/epsilon chain alpha-helix domain-containing protein [Bacilli bacterium]
MQSFKLEVITPEKVYADTMVECLTLNVHWGQISIYAHHSDMIANVEICGAIAKANGHINHYALGGGALNIINKDNKVQLILSSIESYDEIDLPRALKAKAKNEEIMVNAKSISEYNEAETAVKKAIVRITVKSGPANI